MCYFKEWNWLQSWRIRMHVHEWTWQLLLLCRETKNAQYSSYNNQSDSAQKHYGVIRLARSHRPGPSGYSNCSTQHSTRQLPYSTHAVTPPLCVSPLKLISTDPVSFEPEGNQPLHIISASTMGVFTDRWPKIALWTKIKCEVTQKDRQLSSYRKTA